MGDFIGNTYGTLGSAPDGKIIKTIFNYVATVLKDFKGEINDNENQLTNELCKSLGFKKPQEFPFFFHHQNIENSIKNTSTDFAAFGTYSYSHATKQNGNNITLVKFEAKRLSASLPKKREKEYVIGEYEKGKQTKNSGGIERFKNLRHGHDVDYAGIIGYVQSDSFNYWLKKINGWIEKEIEMPHDTSLFWDENDYLSIIDSDNKLCRYKSNTMRKNSKKLNLLHMWVNLI